MDNRPARSAGILPENAAGTAALAYPPYTSRMAVDPAMGQIRIGIIGAGWWAVKNHIPVLQSREDVKITGICRPGPEQLRKIQDEFGIGFGAEDYRELLRRNDLDGVVVSSPHRFHFEHARAALAGGLPVLCEKPMVLSAHEARQLRREVDSRHLHFLIPYGWNYTELASKARELVRQGEIGEIEHVHCHMASATRDLFSGGDFWFTKNDPVKPEPQTWSDPTGGGGFAHGQLTHALGLLFYITELCPERVFALNTSSPTGADLSSAISCKFTNGATGMMGGSGAMPARSTYQVDIRLYGSKGMLLLDIERPRLQLRRESGSCEDFAVTLKAGAYSCSEPLHAFIDLIAGKPGVENRSSAQVGTAVVEVLDAASRSARSGVVQSIRDLD